MIEVLHKPHWCELTKKRTTAVRVRTVFSQVDQFICELDPNLSHTIRTAFLNGLRQHAGDNADPAEYRMNVYGDAGYNELILSDFTVLPAIAYRAESSLEGYSDDELLSELAWRLRGRP